MELKIELSDEKFKELTDLKIDELIDQNVLVELFKDAVREYFKTDEFKNVLKKSLFNIDYYGRPSENLTDLGREAVLKAVSDQDLTEVKECVLEILKSEGDKILIQSLGDSIIKSIFTSRQMQDSLADLLCSNVQAVVDNIIDHRLAYKGIRGENEDRGY